MKINRKDAQLVLRTEAQNANFSTTDPSWVDSLQHFSELCQKSSKTHIAFLGTAILAKATNLTVDVYAVKASAGPNGYAARTLAQHVLAPLAIELGFNIGVTGREPLNNQPYFRIKRVSPDMPVRGGAQYIVQTLCQLLEQLDSVNDISFAKKILRSFIFVRREYCPKYLSYSEADMSLTLEELHELISGFVAKNSEGGKRAQAVVAGLMDLFAGPIRVESGRINDPDRHLAGDVGVRSRDNENLWERVFEVRDKPVSLDDIYFFGTKALDAGVKDAALIAVANQQKYFDYSEASCWANSRGLALTIFFGWQSFVEQALFWSDEPQVTGVKKAAQYIYERLIQLEVSESGARDWYLAIMIEKQED